VFGLASVRQKLHRVSTMLSESSNKLSRYFLGYVNNSLFRIPSPTLTEDPISRDPDLSLLLFAFVSTGNF